MLRDNNSAGWLGAVDREFVFKKQWVCLLIVKFHVKCFFFHIQYGWQGTLLITCAINLHAVAFGALQRPVPKLTNQNEGNEIQCQSHKPNDVGETRDNDVLIHYTTSKAYMSALTKLSSRTDLKTTVSIENEDMKLFHMEEESTRNQATISKDGHSIITKVSNWLNNTLGLFLLKTPSFLLYIISSMLMNIGLLAFFMHCPNRALHLGISRAHVALLPIATGMSEMTSRLVFGFVSDCPRFEEFLFKIHKMFYAN